LLLNLMISFIPGIDMAAHAGGFLTGAVMAFGQVRRNRTETRSPSRPGPLRLAVAVLVLLGVGLTSFQERADLSTRLPAVGTEHELGELRLPIPRSFVVSQSRAKGLTNVEAEGNPASPFSVTYKVSEPQADEQAARRVLETLRPEPATVKDSDWIALSQSGVQNLRAIEIVVTAPASCRAQAEQLGAELASRIR